MQVEYSRQAVKFIAAQDKNTKQRIKRGIEGLTEMPSAGDIKPLLFISDIDSRGDIYK